MEKRRWRTLALARACVLCGLSPGEHYFCDACIRDLEWIDIACEHCGQPLVGPAGSGSLCAECQRRKPVFDKAAAPLVYSFPADSALKALKFRRQLFYAPAFGELLLPLFEEHFQEADALLPVPLHRRRYACRGFNQAVELSRPLQRKSRLPVVASVRRTRHTAAQTGLDAAARRRNMKGAFDLQGPLESRCPLVIDDVMTTGETCNQLAATLLAGGAERVFVLTIARAIAP